MTRKTLNIAIAAALLGTLALAGCKKDQDEAAMTTPPATTEPVPAPMPEPAPAPASSASVTAVDLGNTIGADMKVGAPSTTFAPSDTIYASVATSTSDPAASVPGTLSAKWTFEDGQVVNEESKSVNLTGAGQPEFHNPKHAGLPARNHQDRHPPDGPE